MSRKRPTIDLEKLILGEIDVEYGHEDLVPLDTIQFRSVSWYWRQRIVRNDLNILAGTPGIGKSQIAASIAAEATRRGDSVILMSAEDSAAHTIGPRMVAANAQFRDEAGVALVHTWRQDAAWTITDWQKLQDYIYRVEASLVVIDPVAAFVEAKTDTYKDAHVRGLLAPLHQIAEDQECTILCVMHLKKGIEQEAIYNVGGSVAWTAAPRSVLLAKRLNAPDIGEKNVLVHAKCNVGPQQPTLEYEVVPVDHGVYGPWETSVVRWGAEGTIDYADLFTVEPKEDRRRNRPSPELDRCLLWLKDQLREGPTPKALLREGLEAEGISRNTYQKAHDLLGLTTTYDRDTRQHVVSWPDATV